MTDARSRKIVGHPVHERLHAESVAVAFQQALKQRAGKRAPIHHSDRGAQHVLRGIKPLTPNMTCGIQYDCHQSALAERVNGPLKNELLLRMSEDAGQARPMTREAVSTYYPARLHLSLKYRMPDAVHRAF